MLNLPSAPNIDFSDREQALSFFRQLWLNSLDPFWLCECTEGDFRFLALNSAEQRIDPRFQPGVLLGDVLAGQGEMAEALMSGYFQCCTSKQPLVFEQRPFIGGEERLFQTLLVPVLDPQGAVTHLWGTARDLTPFLKAQRGLEQMNLVLEQRVQARTAALHQANAELQAANAHLARLAACDTLTGLANRRRFFEQANEEIARAQRYGHALSLLMVDLDHFKSINDGYGHAAGDDVLRQLGRCLQDDLRQNDLAARIGGEEFVLLLPETPLLEACQFAERLRQRIAELPQPALRGLLRVTCSIGVASFNPADGCVDSLLERADAACYRAKAAGRNQVQREDFQ